MNICDHSAIQVENAAQHQIMNRNEIKKEHIFSHSSSPVTMCAINPLTTIYQVYNGDKKFVGDIEMTITIKKQLSIRM